MAGDLGWDETLAQFESALLSRAQEAREDGWTPPQPSVAALPRRWSPSDVDLYVEEGRTRDTSGDYWRPSRGLVRARRAERWSLCPVCRGAGSVFPESEWQGHTYTTAAPCRCAELDARIRRYNNAALPAQEWGKDWGNTDWDTDAYLKAEAEGYEGVALRDLLREWLAGWQPGARGWLIQGPTGTGKTHLAHATMQHLVLTHAVSAVWWSTRELGREIEAALKTKQPLHLILQPLIDADVLVFDELREDKSWWWDQVVDALESRLDAYPAKTTIVTTNLKAGADGSLAAVLGDRLASRLRAACTPLTIRGADHRATQLQRPYNLQRIA